MRIFTEPQPLDPDYHGGVAAIGNFDGLHCGHQHLLAVAQDVAHKNHKPWGLLSFEPHPRSFFQPQDPVFRLTPLPLKIYLLKALGADFIYILDFNAALASANPEEFLTTYIQKTLSLAHLVVGNDFHFGKGRAGDVRLLQRSKSQLGYDLSIIDQLKDEKARSAPYSSSAIRTALRHGHLQAAERELGYRWRILGEVIKGDQRGRTLGFPTINIALDKGAEPLPGIYAVRVRDVTNPTQEQPSWPGAGYFGTRPSFSGQNNFLEVYLFDRNDDLYGHQMLVEFIALIRPDKNFKTTQELVEQMHEDCKNIRQKLEAFEQLPLKPALSHLGRLLGDGI